MPTFRPALIALWLYTTLEIATCYTLNVTCSGDKMAVFVDGVNYFGGVEYLPTASPANTVQTIYVPQDNVNIVVIKCFNQLSNSAYIKAAGSDGLVTDASWLCETEFFERFEDINFDDSDWKPAKLKETYNPVLDTSSASLPVNAQWLTQSSALNQLFCRQHTGNNTCLTSNPCQNGGSCATMPTGDMQCWCTSAFTGVNCETTMPMTTTIITTPSPTTTTTTTIPPTTTTTTTTTPPLITTTTLPPTTTTKSTTTTTVPTTTTTTTTLSPTTTTTTTLPPTTTTTTTLPPTTTTTTTLPPTTTTTVTTTPTTTTTAPTTTTTTTTATTTTSTTVSTSPTTTSVTTPTSTTHPASSTTTSISTTAIKVTTASASSGTESSSNIGNSDIVLAGSTSTIPGFTFRPSSITTDSGDSVTRKSPSPHLPIIMACLVAGGVALILVIICLLCILCCLKH